ncbi:LexA family protein [Prevotella sp. kh1p2]|uniref:LexA family protein n=1 Tax=Prevotella sp. kh1p2 TaxID=1761883 RepID=UPI0008C0DD96|nr:translesion error-prone DNA polymerase V autoproteolytic subunit [Prevotella sp. kh1p2]SET09806.1 DNA polymerase V [Prevotella sp. kh1p2]SNU11885.1 DNA polymerase V [Prevotellaceae bacterium KH2P17]
MDEVTIFRGEFDSRLEQPFVSGGIKAGFPSPAQDYMDDTLDLNSYLVKHPAATFYGKVKGDSMKDAGIDEGDILIIDKSLNPRSGDIIIAYLDGEFTMKFLDASHRDEGYIMLVPANAKYRPIRVDATDNFTVWGVVAWTIKKRVASLLNNEL